MSMFKFVSVWLRSGYQKFKDFFSSEKPIEIKVVPIHFHSVTVVERPPKNKEIDSSDFYHVEFCGTPRWALFKCPCGCGAIVTLSLQRVHSPCWTLEEYQSGRPSLHPSIWRDRGCFSHFWVKDGRILWCADTGADPRLLKV